MIKMLGPLAIALTAVGMFGSVASAQQHEPTTVPPSAVTTVPPSTAGGFALDRGLVAFGADITCPDTPARSLDAAHAAAFLESFFAYATFGNPVLEEPPKDLPVCSADIEQLYGADPARTTLSMKYATNGTKSWLLFVGRDVWFVAPPRVKKAFEGKLLPLHEYVEPKEVKPKPKPKPKTAHAKRKTDDSSVLPIVAIGLGIGTALIGGAYLVKRRTGGRSDTMDPNEPAVESGADPVDDIEPEEPR